MAEKMQAYFDTKDAAKRNTLLKELALACPPDGKDFSIGLSRGNGIRT